ncbi:MAG: ATP synthase F0 subunit C [Syntrophorhabdaceae bacterium]|nr:ATP synthase F0 subunit C [Syntrophorhabdaceae bacterium]
MKRLLTVLVLVGIFFGFTYGLALAAEEKAGLDPQVKQMIALAAGFGIAIAAFGGALGQSKGVASALDGIARNPGASGKIFAPMIIGLALIESLVIYAFVVSLILVGKL